MAVTPGATPKKIIDFLSPSGDNICVVCGTDVKEAYNNPCDRKLRLWGNDGSKTNACRMVEDHLRENLDPHTDLKIVCKKCMNAIKNAQSKQHEKHSSFSETRKTVRAKYLRQKFKRGRREESDIEKSFQNSKSEGKEKPRKKLKFKSNFAKGESGNVEGFFSGLAFTEPLVNDQYTSSTKPVWKKVVVSKAYTYIMQHQRLDMCPSFLKSTFIYSYV